MRVSHCCSAYLLSFVVLSGVLVTFNVYAQSRGQRLRKKVLEDTSKSIRIRSIDGAGRSGLVRTPEYRVDNVVRGTRSPMDWARVMVKYDTLPDWINQLTFYYYILLKTDDSDAAETPYTLLEGMVTYAEVRKRNNHVSTVFLHPNTLARYGELVACGVEIVHNDEKVAKEERTGGARLKPGKWWTAIRGEKSVTVKTGYVLNRSETPFAFVNYDSFEQIRR